MSSWITRPFVNKTVFMFVGQELSGKTTASKIVRGAVDEVTPMTLTKNFKFAGAVRDEAQNELKGLDALLDAHAESFKTTTLREYYGPGIATGRQLLIKIGQDRRVQDPDYWVKKTLADITAWFRANDDRECLATIDDARYPNEVKTFCRELGPICFCFYLEDRATVDFNPEPGSAQEAALESSRLGLIQDVFIRNSNTLYDPEHMALAYKLGSLYGATKTMYALYDHMGECSHDVDALGWTVKDLQNLPKVPIPTAPKLDPSGGGRN